MADISIVKLNETYMKAICSEVYMELDIQDRFSFKTADAQFDPRVRKGHWDGIKRLYNRKTKKLYIGLLFELINFIDKKGWSYTLDPDLLPSEEQLDDEDLKNLIKFINPHHKGEPIDPYDYQIEAVKYMLNMDRSVVLAATSAGKSLMLYIAVRVYQLMEELHNKTIFITVPSVSLVEQLYNDFRDYSSFEGSDWHVNRHCQKVSGKYPKRIEKQIVITTWQSMQKLPYDDFEAIGAIFIDETHTAKASVLSKLIEQATNTPIKHGLTGTLDDSECNQLVIQGLLGPAKRIVTAKDIIDKGRAAPINVQMVMLSHRDEHCSELYQKSKNLKGNLKYQTEIEFINAMDNRKEFIYGILDSLQGNTLVLFDRVEEYGNLLYEEYKDLNPNKDVFLITGGVDSVERESIRTSMEDLDNGVIWASFGTMSTGVSIKKLHNLILISSSKSKIRVLQSIGRLMRLHASKDGANIIDVVDNLTWNGEPNYTMKHSVKRIEYYQTEQFPIQFMDIAL